MDIKIKQYLLEEYESTKQQIDLSKFKQQVIIDAINDQLVEIFAFDDERYADAVRVAKQKWVYWYDQVDKSNFTEIMKYLYELNLISPLKYNNWLMHSSEHSSAIISDLKNLLFDYISDEVFRIYFNHFKTMKFNLVNAMLDKVKLINKLTKDLSHFSRIFGNLWDLTPDKLYKINIKSLVKLEKVLCENNFIEEIAKILGRVADSFDDSKNVFSDQEVFKPAKFTTSYGTDNITSIKHGNDIPIVLKHQLALRYSKNGNKLFKYLYLEKKLLELDQNSKLLDTTQHNKLVNKQVNKQGPFIVCVDTSGSMSGLPELIAKALCLAIVRIANEQNRSCFIYTFSIRTMGFDATKISKDFTAFNKFISSSFTGGTDIMPVLNNAIDKLQEEAYKNADVLVISDFQINEIEETLLIKINECKNNSTRFHSLLIGDNMTGIPDIFDNAWTYDGSKESALGIIGNLRMKR